MNRRNAILGWATWTVFSQLLKRKLNARSAPVEEPPRRFARWRAEEVEPPKKKRRPWRVVALLSATVVGVGIWIGARRARSVPVE